MSIFHGMSAFPITPADIHGQVDARGLCRLLQRLVDAEVQSVGLLGSTGTYVYLTRTERQRAIAAAVDCIGGRIPLIVGAGALRTDECQSLARDAELAGADALLLAPVSYTPLTEEEVYRHFVAVAGATKLPLCIYNNPSTTHFAFSVALIERLAKIPNISAVKMPLPANVDYSAELQRLRGAVPKDFLIGYSGDWGCADALLAGADTWYSVVGGLLPIPALRLTRAGLARDRDQTRNIDRCFQPLWALFKEFGSLRVVFEAANILSLTDCAPPRPILGLPAEARPRVEEALDCLSAVS